MTLINLNLIKDLETQTSLSEAFAFSGCYNYRQVSNLPPEVFVEHVKRAKQARALYGHLKSLHQECTDFARGNFQSYLNVHQEWDDGDTAAFDPFEELHYHFDSGTFTDLPSDINQYRELIDFLPNVSDYRTKINQDFTAIFGDAFTSGGSAADKEGKGILVPRSEFSEGVFTEQNAKREIEGISVEYCLDGYNKFYQRCRALIEAHRTPGSLQVCTKEILALFAPHKENVSFSS